MGNKHFVLIVREERRIYHFVSKGKWHLQNKAMCTMRSLAFILWSVALTLRSFSLSLWSLAFTLRSLDFTLQCLAFALRSLDISLRAFILPSLASVLRSLA